MSVKKLQSGNNIFYYVTFTCYEWLHLFKITKLYDYIYNWFDLIKKNYNISINAYVIMPNHLHFVAFIPEQKKNVNDLMGESKRFIAYEIVKRLEKANNKLILAKLEKGVTIKEKERGKLHKVFEASSDIKYLNSEKFISQKINYIHSNPVAKHWRLIDDYRYYKYSSAGFYENISGYEGYPVTHYIELLDKVTM